MGPSTLASWALLIARALRERGVDADELFRRAGMPPNQLRDPNSRYPADAMQRLWTLAAGAARDPCFGLEVGRLWHPTTFHALGYVALASATLREALGDVVRYCNVVTTGAGMDVMDDGADVAFRLRSRMPAGTASPESARIAVQAGLAAIATLCREARGRMVRLRHVSFAHEEAGCRARMTEFFGCPVAFAAADNAIVLPAGELDAPLPTVNQELLQINRQLMADYLAGLESSKLAPRVRSQLVRLLPSGESGQQAVARSLGLSLRSLQRKLNGEGVTFRQLLDHTRRQLARHYLKDPTLSAAEVAYLLGFSETSSLSRAMRRWRGQLTRDRA